MTAIAFNHVTAFEPIKTSAINEISCDCNYVASENIVGNEAFARNEQMLHFRQRFQQFKVAFLLC